MNMALFLFMSTFLVARLMGETGDDLLAVGLFKGVWWIGIGVAFAVTSYIIKRSSRVWAVRIAAFLKVATIILVIFLQEYIADIYLLFAVIYGVAEGVYWGSILTLTAQSFAGKRMAGFVVWEQVARGGASILMPFTLGAIIDFASFEIAAIISFVLGIILVAFTMIIKEEKTRACKPLSMRQYLRTMKQTGKSRAVWYHFWLQTLHDSYRRLVVLFTVLIVVALGSNLSLGVFGSVFAAATILAVMLYKFVGPKTRAGAIMYWLSAAAPLALGFWILFEVNTLTIILIHLGYVGLGSVMRLEVDKLRFNIMSYLKDESWHTESLLLTEYAFLIPRVIVPVIIILAHFFDLFLVVQILAVVLTALVILVAWMTKQWHKKFCAVEPHVNEDVALPKQ